MCEVGRVWSSEAGRVWSFLHCQRFGLPALWPSSPPSVAPGAAVATAPRVDVQRMGELRQHGIDLMPLHPYCTEARMLTYDPSWFRLKESCSQCNTYLVPQPPEEPYFRHMAHDGPGTRPDSGVMKAVLGPSSIPPAFFQPRTSPH